MVLHGSIAVAGRRGKVYTITMGWNYMLNGVFGSLFQQIVVFIMRCLG